jgi:hypothetical protein
MPILIFVLLVIAVAQIGFWDTLTSILGAAAVLLIFLLVVAGLIALSISYAWRRIRSRI